MIRKCEFCGKQTALKHRKCCKSGEENDKKPKTILLLIKGEVDRGIHSFKYSVIGVSSKHKPLLKIVNSLMKIAEAKKEKNLIFKKTMYYCWENTMTYYEIIERDIL